VDLFSLSHRRFKGDLRLKKERERLYDRQDLNVENKVAATLIGYPLSTDFRHFPNCSPYHPILMRHAEKYFRGATHPLSKLFHADASEKQGGLGRIPSGTHKEDVPIKALLSSPDIKAICTIFSWSRNV